MAIRCFKIAKSVCDPVDVTGGTRVLFLDRPPRSRRDAYRTAYVWRSQRGLPPCEPRSDHRCFKYEALLAEDVDGFPPMGLGRGVNKPREVLFGKKVSWRRIQRGSIRRLRPPEARCNQGRC